MKIEYPICLMVVLKADRCCITYEGVHDERRDFLTASKREDSEIEDFRKGSLISAVLEIPLVGEDRRGGTCVSCRRSGNHGWSGFHGAIGMRCGLPFLALSMAFRNREVGRICIGY